MIASNDPQKKAERDQKFFDMVKKGATLTAAPETAMRVMDWADKNGYSVAIRVNPHLEEAQVYAIDPKIGTQPWLKPGP